MKPWIIAVTSVVVAAIGWALLVADDAPAPPPREPEVVEAKEGGSKKAPHVSTRPTTQFKDIDRSKLQKIEIPPEAFEKARKAREAAKPAPEAPGPAGQQPPAEAPAAGGSQ